MAEPGTGGGAPQASSVTPVTPAGRPRGPRPNALIVGAGKAGSTSLHNYLAQHPEIFGSRTKELMYFTAHHGEGPAWLAPHFPETPGARIYFESTPQYSFRDEFPETAARIHAFNPAMKILYIVREPISRIVSHFNHWSRVFPERYTDITASLADPKHRRFFVDRTRYFYQIEAYRACFPDAQIHIVFLEALKADFIPTLNAAFRFLGVAPEAARIDPRIYNKRPPSEAPVVTRADIPAARQAEIAATLAPDVQALFAYAGQDPALWGPAYR